MARTLRLGRDKTTQILRSLHVAGKGSEISYAIQVVPISPTRERAKMEDNWMVWDYRILYTFSFRFSNNERKGRAATEEWRAPSTVLRERDTV